MNRYSITPGNSLVRRQGKDKDVYSFLKAVPHLKKLSRQSILKLSQRFNINSDAFTLLISMAASGGCFYYDN